MTLDDFATLQAGRALYLTLHPFSRRERLGRLGEPPVLLQILDGSPPPVRLDVPPVVEDEVLDGGLPPVALGDTARGLWFLGYEQTYLEREVRDLSQVADIVSFRNLLHLAALRTGQLLNQSDLARDARLPATTARRYLGVLEAPGPPGVLERAGPARGGLRGDRRPEHAGHRGQDGHPLRRARPGGPRACAANTPDVRAGILVYNGTEALPVGDRLWAVPLAVLLA